LFIYMFVKHSIFRKNSPFYQVLIKETLAGD